MAAKWSMPVSEESLWDDYFCDVAQLQQEREAKELYWLQSDPDRSSWLEFVNTVYGEK
jgi:hypothetical protein